MDDNGGVDKSCFSEVVEMKSSAGVFPCEDGWRAVREWAHATHLRVLLLKKENMWVTVGIEYETRGGFLLF